MMQQAGAVRPKLSEREGFAAFVMRMRARGVNDQRLFAAIEAAQRPAFLNPIWRHLAYSSRTMPLECGEYIEGLDDQARVIAALNLEDGHRVLEIGTGSGFTAAVMARLAGRVTTIERYRGLCEQARQRFQAQKLENITVKQLDGRHGVTGGPFDRIVCWLAVDDVPRQFIELLATSGVLVAPIGPGDDEQIMARLAKTGSRFERDDLMIVRFQPFIEGVASVL